MDDKLASLLDKMRLLERELLQEFRKKEGEFFYEIRQKKIHFTREATARHRKLVHRLHQFVMGSEFFILLCGPVIWACAIPLFFCDVVVTIYQALCFPVYGIPKVRRSDYMVFDRHRLAYLNFIEKFNCEYCAYANGLLAYLAEVAARTEQYWCPIKHALRMKSYHSRYQYFFDYGDAERYHKEIEKIRRKFEDIDAPPPGAS